MVKKKNRKTIILSLAGIVLLILAVIGVSYAAVFYAKTGEKINRVTTGTMTMSYSENTNGINLMDAYPITDEVGKSLNEEGEYFDFTVAATMGGDVVINYVITAAKTDDSTLPDNAIKVYLTNINNSTETQVLKPTKVSDLQVTSDNPSGAPNGQFELLASNFNKTSVRNYRLRMWISNDYTLPNFSQVYKLRVNVYGAVGS